MRVAHFLSLLWLASCASCAGAKAYPTAVDVKAYVGPREPSGDFVVVYEPWGPTDAVVTGTGSVEVLARLEGAKVRCVNIPCESREAGGAVRLTQPPPGVDHLELVVEKKSFDPVRFSVPFDYSASYRRTLVLMKPTGAPP
jgi:hypothetical protein